MSDFDKRHILRRVGWRAYGWPFVFIYVARRFRVGSRPNCFFYRLADYVFSRRVSRAVRAASSAADKTAERG